MEVHGWSMELLTHGSLERKRHGLLGFHPNHAHYISMLMLHEIATSGTSCVSFVCGQKLQVCVLSQSFPRVCGDL